MYSLVCGDDSGYELVVDGSTIWVGENDDFGEEISFVFGNCGGGGGNSGGSCIPLILEMRTDSWGEEIQMDLTDNQNESIWSVSDFDSNTDYRYDACLDRDGCSKLQILDSLGDGYVCGK
jgi:hypothetical protein